MKLIGKLIAIQHYSLVHASEAEFARCDSKKEIKVLNKLNTEVQNVRSVMVNCHGF